MSTPEDSTAHRAPFACALLYDESRGDWHAAVFAIIREGEPHHDALLVVHSATGRTMRTFAAAANKQPAGREAIEALQTLARSEAP